MQVVRADGVSYPDLPSVVVAPLYLRRMYIHVQIPSEYDSPRRSIDAKVDRMYRSFGTSEDIWDPYTPVSGQTYMTRLLLGNHAVMRGG